MSQLTSQLGDNLISGILSGQKFRQFQSDLKTSEIQRQMLEQQMGFQQTMQPLLQAHQQALNDNERIRGQGLTLAQQLAEATYGATVDEAQARADTAKVGAETAKGMKDAQIGTAKATAAHQKALALKAQLDGLGDAGAGGMQFTPQDYSNLLDAWGVDSGEKGARDVMTKMLAGKVAEGQQRFEDNRTRINAVAEQNRAAAEASKASALHNEITGGAAISDLFAQAEPEVAQPLIAKLDAGGKLSPADYAKLAVSSYKRKSAAGASDSVVTTDPAEIASQTELGKNIETLYVQLNAAKRAKKELESGRPLKGEEASYFSTDSTDRKALIKQQDASIAELEDQIKFQEGRKKSVTKTTDRTAGGTTKSLSYPPEIIAYAKANNLSLKSNPTQAEIDQAIAFIKSKKK